MSNIIPVNPAEFFKNKLPFNLIPKYNFLVDFSDTISQLIINMGFYQQYYPNDATSIVNTVLKLGVLVDNIIDLMFVVKSIELPEIVIDSEELKIGTIPLTRIKGAQLNGDLVIEFRSDDLNMARKLYYTWIQILVDPKTNAGKPRLITEADITVFIYNRIGILVEKRIYHNCKPVSIDKLRYDVDETGFQDSIVMTFKCNNGMTIEGVG